MRAFHCGTAWAQSGYHRVLHLVDVPARWRGPEDKRWWRFCQDRHRPDADHLCLRCRCRETARRAIFQSLGSGVPREMPWPSLYCPGWPHHTMAMTFGRTERQIWPRFFLQRRMVGTNASTPSMGGCYEGAISPIAIRGNRVRSVTCTSEMVVGVGRHPSLREEPILSNNVKFWALS